MSKPLYFLVMTFFPIITFVSIISSGFAGEQILLQKNASWKQINVGKKPQTKFHFSGNTLEITADKSVAFFYREIQPVMSSSPQLKWQWRVNKNIPATDQSIPNKDDRPLAVHLWFDDGPASVFGSIATLFGYPRVGYLITYVWGGKRAAGSILPNPHFPKAGAIIILRNGASPTGIWRSESRNIVADFKRSFGRAPKLSALRYVAISGDTDDSQTSSRSQLRNFKITENP